MVTPEKLTIPDPNFPTTVLVEEIDYRGEDRKKFLTERTHIGAIRC
jgi:hypothetical protein